MHLRELSVVDDTLEALGAPKKYQWLRKWIIRLMIGWIVYVFCSLLLLESVLRVDFGEDINFNIYEIFVMFYSEYVNALSALIWGTIIGLVHI